MMLDNIHTCPNPAHAKMVAMMKRAPYLAGRPVAYGHYRCPVLAPYGDVNCDRTGKTQPFSYVMSTPCLDCMYGFAEGSTTKESKQHWRFEFTRTIGGEKVCFRAVFYDTKQCAIQKAHMLKEQLPRRWEGPVEDGYYD